ncbi:MAG TPA: AI-2E family transporter [Gemmataceae bacterium]|jgi:predicted PurR-regulated permease PerM/CheY-like chemotaxis protein|nr:AI-2E family transporter [Gemmataceae bacterium]
MPWRRSSTRLSYLYVLASLALTVAVLYLAKPVVVPLALAVLLAFILNPVIRAAELLKVGRIPAVLLTVLLTFGVLGVVGWAVGRQVNNLVRELPEHQEKIQEKIASLRGSGHGPIARLLQMVREIGAEPGKTTAPANDPAARQNGHEATSAEKPVVLTWPEDSSGFGRLANAVGPVLEQLATAGLVIILVVYMLIRREDLRNRLISLLGHGHLTGTTRVIMDAAQRLGRFLLTQLLVNVGFGSVFGLGLLIIGVPYAFLWGFLTAVLRFVPYIGTWAAAAFPLILSFALSSSWTQPLIVLAFLVVLDLTTANVIEPLLFGHTTGVTPIALLVAAAFWTWIWGPIGLVLSTPLTVCLVVLGQHIPRLKFFTLLLGNEPPLAPHIRYYQRLLARDQAEAEEVVAKQLQAHGLDRVYDDVLLPALVLARRDRKNDGLSVEDEMFIYEATRGILTHLDPESAAAAAGQVLPFAPPVQESPAKATILGWPAHHESEELSLHMLARVLKPDGCRLEVASTRTLPDEVEALVEQQKPALVVIAILPPGGISQARYVSKRLRKRYPKLPIIVGYSGAVLDFDRLLLLLRSAGASYVTTSLHQTRRQIRALVSGLKRWRGTRKDHRSDRPLLTGPK